MSPITCFYAFSEAAFRRLVDPDHASRLDDVVAALSVLGRGLIIEDQKQVAAWVRGGARSDLPDSEPRAR
jgi:hypothetical protein